MWVSKSVAYSGTVHVWKFLRLSILSGMYIVKVWLKTFASLQQGD